jgi:hypothetical protein
LVRYATAIVGKGSTTMNVGNAGSVQGILGPLTLTDPTGLIGLTVDEVCEAIIQTSPYNRGRRAQST